MFIINENISNKFQFLVCSWNHEYYGSLGKLTLQETLIMHDSMKIPEIEFIS